MCGIKLSAGLCAKNAGGGGAYARGRAYLRDTTVSIISLSGYEPGRTFNVGTHDTLEEPPPDKPFFRGVSQKRPREASSISLHMRSRIWYCSVTCTTT